MGCVVCGAPAQIHETVVRPEKVTTSWCLDHAPGRFVDDVARIRAYECWQARMEKVLAERAAKGEATPSWKVIASSAFDAGVRHARGE